ncbi:3851_t:CDS:2 [Ambispora gerdemannii]|uniref:3851_t:CDS:1 n=1 Tax=Ambispora gerdemannii TaxID=144530 RepID=A0A9N9CVH9_9GLOM|nr:3851_t:CDS:2 [Ambispora gerdemannii]
MDLKSPVENKKIMMKPKNNLRISLLTCILLIIVYIISLTSAEQNDCSKLSNSGVNGSNGYGYNGGYGTNGYSSGGNGYGGNGYGQNGYGGAGIINNGINTANGYGGNGYGGGNGSGYGGAGIINGNGGNGYGGGDGENGVGYGGAGIINGNGGFGGQCTQCLSTLSSLTVNSVQNDTRSPLTCQHYSRLVTQISQGEASSNSKFTGDQRGLKFTANSNYTFLNGEIQNFCSSSNPCDSSTSVKGYKQILKDCATELSSNSYDGILAKQYFLNYYFASPDYTSLCTPGSKGGSAWKQIGVLEFDYITKNFSKNDSTIYIKFPLQPQIHYSFSNSRDDNTEKVPASILCNDDYKKVSNIYIDYVAANSVDSKFASLISVVDELKSNLSANSCSGVDVASSSKENDTLTSDGSSSGGGMHVVGIVGSVVLGILTMFILPFF